MALLKRNVHLLAYLFLMLMLALGALRVEFTFGENRHAIVRSVCAIAIETPSDRLRARLVEIVDEIGESCRP